MLDLWMTATLIAAFALVAGFAIWCERTVEETEGERS